MADKVLVTRAEFNGVRLAETENCKVIEDVYYFPPEAVKKIYLQPSNYRTQDYWKGAAEYYNVIVDRRAAVNAARCYVNPGPQYRNLKNHFVFGDEIQIVIAGCTCDDEEEADRPGASDVAKE